MRRMGDDGDQARPASPSTELGEALAAIHSGSDGLRSLGFNEEASEVEGVVSRLSDGAPARQNIFRRQGDHWVVLFEADSFRLRHTLGMAYLARLLSHPGREVHVLDLVGSSDALASDAGPVLDAQARHAYRERIEELAEALEDAERRGDTEREAAWRHEMELLAAELSGASGLGGRERPAGSTVERARQAVTKALKSTLRRISAESPALGQHLASTVRTGSSCRYDPDPRLPITWRI